MYLICSGVSLIGIILRPLLEDLLYVYVLAFETNVNVKPGLRKSEDRNTIGQLPVAEPFQLLASKGKVGEDK
jgi:hypothetical protein